MITMQEFWKGRDVEFRSEFTPQINASGIEVVRRINMLIARSKLTRDKLSSGWRPKSVNDRTSNAGKASNHITADAGDVIDDQTRAFAQWCVLHPDDLAACGLWMENPQWCAKWNDKTGQFDYWVHLQSVPPKSGKRIYVPSLAAPIAPPLTGQKPLPHMPKL